MNEQGASWAERTLKRSGELFSRVLESSTDAIAVIRAEDQIFLYVNDVFCRLSSYTAGEIVGHATHEFPFFVDEAAQVEIAEGLAANGQVTGVVSRFRSKQGNVTTAEVSAELIDVDGVPCILSMSRDVTTQLRREAALRDREAILEAASFTAEKLLQTSRWEDAILPVLERLALATGASWVSVYRNHLDGDGEQLLCSLAYEWMADGLKPHSDYETNYDFPFRGGFERWVEVLSTGGVIAGPAADLPPAERDVVASGVQQSLAVVPIFVDDEWWGFLSLGDVSETRTWATSEIEGLRVAAGALGAAIQRDRVTEQLREIENVHRAIVEQIPGVLYIETPYPESRLVYLSPQYEVIYGVTVEERLADSRDVWIELIHPDDAEHVLAVSEANARSEEPYHCEFRIIARDGTVRWMRDQAQLIRDEDGAPLHWYGLMVDITEAQHAKQELARSEERFRRLVEQIPVATYTEPFDEDPDRFYISPQVERMTGYPPDKWSDSAWWRSILHPEDRDRVIAQEDASVQAGGSYSIEFRIVGAEGQVVWLSENAELIGRPGDPDAYWQGTIADITERKRQAMDLAEADARYRALVERVPAITYQEEVPPEGYQAGNATFVYVSPQIEEVLGYEPGTFQDSSEAFWDSRVHPNDRTRVLAASIEATEQKENYRQEYRMIAADDRVVWILDESVLVRDDPDTGTQVWHGVMIDITERRAAEDQLRDAEERYRSLVEQIPAIVYIDREDPDSELGWRMVYVSPQIEELTGFPTEQWLEKDVWFEQLHPEDRESAVAYDAAAVKEGGSYSSEYRLIAKDGRTIWIEEQASVLAEADETRYWQGVMIDITDRKRTERELRRRDSVLQAVGAAAESFLHVRSWEASIDETLASLGEATAASRVYVFQNHEDEQEVLRTAQSHEWVAPGIESQHGRPVVQDVDLAAYSPRWIATLSGGDVIAGPVGSLPEAERPMLDAQGIRSIAIVPVFVDEQWWGLLGFDDCVEERVWSEPELDALRTASSILGTAIEREHAETQLTETEERYRQLVERTPAVVYMDAIDDVSTALYISPQVKELLGYTPEEHLAAPGHWRAMLHPDDRESVLAESRRTNETGDPFALDYRLIHRDGHVVWVRDESVIIRDEAGKPLYWQGVLIDITERKRAEQELGKALSMERDAAERLRALDEMKNTFLTAVSHDLRTPLAAVLGLALTLAREDMQLDADETRDLARRIATNARKLDRMVADLLDLDRLSRGVLEPQLNRTDVGFLVRKVVDEADFMRGHPVAVEADPVVAAVDMAKVERIVENLLANAARHTPPGTQIWVRVRDAGDDVLIAVEDAGPGVLAELKEAVFEPFRQGDTDTLEVSPGVGIGLSLVARFATLHGGKAWVEDREGGGASFRVLLPKGAGEAG